MKKFIKRNLENIIIAALVASVMAVLFGPEVSAVVKWPPAALLQPNDITSSHIRDGAIVNADVSSTAAIAFSKINANGAIANVDVSSTAAIAGSKLNLANTITNAMVSSTAAISADKLANGSTNQIVDQSTQTWNGEKTFGSIPVLPASDPTTDNQAARKAYVDGKVVPNLYGASSTPDFSSNAFATTTAYSVTIPANSLTGNNFLEVESKWNFVNTIYPNINVYIYYYLGNTIVASTTVVFAATETQDWILKARIAAANSSSAQETNLENIKITSSTTYVANIPASVDMTQNQTFAIKLSYNSGDTNLTETLYYVFVKRFHL